MGQLVGSVAIICPGHKQGSLIRKSYNTYADRAIQHKIRLHEQFRFDGQNYQSC